jgi:hypothetical protein
VRGARRRGCGSEARPRHEWHARCSGVRVAYSPTAFRLACVFAFLFSAGCNRDRLASSNNDRPAHTQSGSRPVETSLAAPAPELPAEWRKPIGWRWETNTDVGFTIAYPALPQIVVTPGGEQRLVARTDQAECSVSLAPPGDTLANLHKGLAAAGWSVVAERSLSNRGSSLEVTNGTLTSIFRIVPDGTRTFILSSTAPVGSAFDHAVFLDSFEPRGVVEPRPVHVTPGRFSVTVPGRVSETDDRSATPEILGVAGTIDGVQFSADVADIVGPPAEPHDALERGANASLAAVGARAVETKRDDFKGHASIRILFEANDGMRGVRRMVVVEKRLYALSVYAPGHRAPAWADAFVDSLELDPS